jgi:hypothetical protein
MNREEWIENSDVIDNSGKRLKQIAVDNDCICLKVIGLKIANFKSSSLSMGKKLTLSKAIGSDNTHKKVST